MADLDITGRVVVDASQAEGAFDRVADKAEQMGREVANAAKQAGKEVDGMGDGANTSAEKFTRAEARIRDSIKRSTQELNLLGKTASEKLEFKIADKGLDSSKFTSYIAELKKAEAAQMALGAASVRSGSVASASLDSMGMSAKQTTAALRQVPMQFTDIVVSLQGGQSAMQVFLQQGGQLKDMFGGAGNAARALGGYVVGLINPFTLAAGAAAALGLAYFQGSKEADAYNKAIITTGNAAGTTASQMQQMAQRISSVVGTQGAAAATLAQLAGSSRIAAENFEYFGTVALKVEKTVGTAVAETVKQFAELGKAPVEASKKLNEETNYLTQAIYEQIKALKDQGREAEAAATAQKAYADAINSRSDQMTQNLGLIERAWRGITGAAKGAWDAMLNVGRQDTLQDQIGAIRTRLDAARSERGMTGSFGQTGIDKGIEVLQQRLSLLTEQERLLKRGAESQAARAQAEKAAIEATDALGKANEKALTKQEQMNKALGEYRANLEKVKAVNPNSALLDPAQVAKSEKAIREQFAERTNAVAAGNNELQKQADLIAKLSGLDPSFSREWDMLSKAYKSGALNLDQLVQAQAALLAKQPAMTAQIKAQAEAEKERAKSAAELAKTLEAYAKAQQEGVAQGFQAAQQAEDQLAQYGLLKSEVQALTLAYLEQSRESAALAGEDVSNIDKRITAQKRLIAATYGIEQRDAAKKAAQDAESEWQKTADSINQSLTDALLRGFESGKDFAKNLRDTVVNMFKTLVLRPIISAIVSPVAGAITGGLGLAGTASAATSTVGAIGSGASLLGSAGSLLGGAGTAAGYGFSALMSGNGLGALSGGLGMLTSGGPAAIMAQGAGMIAGVLGPIALGIGALTAIIGKTKGETRTGGQFGVAFDGSVTNQRRDQTYTYQGQQFDRDFSNGARNALMDGQAYRLEGDPVAQESAIRDAVAGTAKGIDAFLQALGSTARLAGFSAGLETSGKGRGGVFSGGRFADGTAFGESGKGDNYEGTLFEKFSSTSPDFKQALSDFTLDLKQSTIQALQTVTDIPKSVQAMLANVDAEGLTDEAANALLESINAQIVGVGNLRKAFEAMDMPQFADLAFDSAAAIAALSGGFDALGQNLATYYDNFYSEAERAANTTQNITKALAGLGLAVPAGVDQFRALVDAQDLSTEAGQKTYATLLSVSGAFAAVTQAAEAAAKAERDLAASRQGALRSAFGGLAKSLADMRAGVGEADARVADARMGIWEGYNDAQQRVIDLEMQAADATRSFAQSLRGFVSDLTTGPASGMGLGARYQMLGQQFSATATRAGAGDQGARDSLTGVASAYLDAARSNARTSVDYARDAARVSAQLNKLATVAETDPLVQKYDAESLSIQQQIADAQIDVVKYLALMEATGTSTDLGIQTVDKTLAALRDEYVGATQAQAAANLKLDVALAALDALGLTEELVKAVAANQSNSLSAALNISDEALASITGALGLTPENLAGIGQQFAVEIALLVGQAATDLAGSLSAALAFDPAAFDALRTVIGYDTASPDFAALHTILGFDLESDKFRSLQTILGMAPEASAQVDALLGGISFAPATVGQIDLIAEGLGFSDAAMAVVERLKAGVGFGSNAQFQIDLLAAGVSFTDSTQQQIGQLGQGVGFTDSAAAQAAHLTAGLGFADRAREQIALIAAGVSLTDAAGAQVDGLNAGVGWSADVAAQVQGLLGGVPLTAAASAQVDSLLAGLTLSAGASAQVDGLLAGLQLAAADRVTVQQLLGGIGFDTDTATALQDGLGLQQGLLPMLGTALGLSAEAQKAIGVLSNMGTIDQTVRNAYAMVGRSGIGSDVSQIDQEGYDFWTKSLATGAVSMTDFTQQFLQSAAGAPDEALRAYIAPYMKKLGIPGFAVGTSYVPQDMVAQIHRGEEITPRPYVDAQAADRQQTNALLARLVQSNAELKAELAEIKRSSQTTATGMTGIVNKQVTLVTEVA